MNNFAETNIHHALCARCRIKRTLDRFRYVEGEGYVCLACLKLERTLKGVVNK